MDTERITVDLIKGDVKPTVALFYRAEDYVFFERYHKAWGGYCECVNDTCNSFSKDSDFFLVMKGWEKVGYFARTIVDGISVLEGFHIRKGYRTKEVFEGFWQIVRDAFSDEFYTGVLADNYPAIHHLKKNGFEEVTTIFVSGKCFILFKNKLI